MVFLFGYSVPIEPPTDVYARPVSSTEAVVWWLPVVDTGTGLQQYIEGYQVHTFLLIACCGNNGNSHKITTKISLT